jgi:NOL1/NOP2/fmu family ribosome biogenesis protein
MQAKKINFLSKKEVERIEKIIEKNYGAKLNFRKVALAQTSKEKIWILSKKICEVDLSKLRINSVGLYFGKLKANEKIRLSIEGCQLVGNCATKNVAILSKSEAEKFMKGCDVKVERAVDCEERNFVLVKYKNDFLGTGKFSEGKVENLIPKSRRLLNLT